MARTQGNAKGRRSGGSFAAFPHAVLKTQKYAALSSWGVKLLVDICAQYNGRNNGDLQAAWSCMSKRGWHSKGTLHRAIQELESAGFILRTRQGGRNACSLFAVTWENIDECKDRRTGFTKLDVGPTKVAAGTWKDGE